MQIKLGRADWKNAVLTAVAAGVCYWLTLALGLKTGYWAAITCIVVCLSEVGATLAASRDRLIGTAIGALTGWGAVLIWRGHVAVFGLAVGVTIVLCNVLDLKTAGRLAGVTVAIVVLVPRVGPAWQMAGSRFLEVSLGVVVALGMTVVFYPKSVLRGGLKMRV
jgi:uncharacterized membrane protein YccC